MRLDLNEKKSVAVLLGAGSMGTAILRRVAAGKKILLGDISAENLERAAETLRYGGYDVETQATDACDKSSVEAFAAKAASLGEVAVFIDTAGASPSQASPEKILALDLIGTAIALDAFGPAMARGGAGLIVASMTGYMPSPLSAEDENALAMTPTAELSALPCLQPDVIVNPGVAYIVSKRANQLRVRAMAATVWGERGARVNTISPGIIVTPLAYDEFESPGNAYQDMIAASPARRAGTAFLLGPDAAFITGTDLLVDGGTIAALKSGRFGLQIH